MSQAIKFVSVNLSRVRLRLSSHLSYSKSLWWCQLLLVHVICF